MTKATRHESRGALSDVAAKAWACWTMLLHMSRSLAFGCDNRFIAGLISLSYLDAALRALKISHSLSITTACLSVSKSQSTNSITGVSSSFYLAADGFREAKSV